MAFQWMMLLKIYKDKLETTLSLCFGQIAIGRVKPLHFKSFKFVPKLILGFWLRGQDFLLSHLSMYGMLTMDQSTQTNSKQMLLTIAFKQIFELDVPLHDIKRLFSKNPFKCKRDCLSAMGLVKCQRLALLSKDIYKSRTSNPKNIGLSK